MQSLLLYIDIFEWESCISVGIQDLRTGIECSILGYMDFWLIIGNHCYKGKKVVFTDEYALFLTGPILKTTDIVTDYSHE